jgi:hypothetical protein
MKFEVDLTDREYEVLVELAEKKDLSLNATIRQALRLYQLQDEPQVKSLGHGCGWPGMD